MSLDGGAKWTVLRRTGGLSWPVNVGKNGQHRLSEWHKEAKKTGWTEGPHRLALEGREGRGCFQTWDTDLDLQPSVLPSKCAIVPLVQCVSITFFLAYAAPNPDPNLKVRAN